MARSSLMPGFRFHPTDVELVMYYLKRKLLRKKIISNAVAEVNIYEFCPWDLPDKSSLKSGDLEWFFFCPKSKKYSSGGRANRSTENGFWKATGKDRTVKYKGRTVATIKTLIFHIGRAAEGQRTDWVMHEFRMDDQQLATEGIVQDAYVLCKIFQKSGSGPKAGAQYGAPFNEEEWDDDVVSSLDSQAIIGPAGAFSSMDHKQKGPTTTNLTESCPSVVTFSADVTTDSLNYKQKGPATITMTEPGSSTVMNEPINTLSYEQKGPATMTMTEPGSSTVMNEPINTRSYKQKGPATMTMTEPGSSTVMNEPINTLSYKQKGPATTNMTEPGSFMVMDDPINALNYIQNDPATMNMSLPQITHGLSVTVTEPGSSSVALSTNEMPANDDVMYLEDLDLIMMGVPEGADVEEAKTMAPNEDDGIYSDLGKLLDLDTWNDFTTDEPKYIVDELPRPDDLNLWTFYVD